MDAVARGTWLDRHTADSSSGVDLVPLSRANPRFGGIRGPPPGGDALDQCSGSSWFSRWIYIRNQASFPQFPGLGRLVPLFDVLVLYAAGYLRTEIDSS